MTSLADRCYVHRRMSTELNLFRNGPINSQMPAIESLFNAILNAARLEVEWFTEEMDEIYSVVGNIFVEGNDEIQAKAFDFMQELIDIFYYESGTYLLRETGVAIAAFTQFYSAVVLRHSNSSALFTKASKHAEEHVRVTQPHRESALKAFDMSLFGEYPIVRYEKKAVKNLLKILKQKMSCHGDTEAIMPGIIRFIGNVCENQNSCGTVILMCGVLEDLLGSIVSREAHSELDLFEGCPVFKWIMSHADRPRSRKKCWVAIARFTKAVFLSGHRYVVDALVREGVFSRLRYMLRDNRDTVLMEFLGAVSAAFKNTRLIERLISEKILLDTLQIVEHGRASRRTRMAACKIFSGFLRHATSLNVYLAAEGGITVIVVELLKSSNELAVISALRWMLEMNNKCNIVGKGDMFIEQLMAAKGCQVLEQLREHSEGSIKEFAEYIYQLLFVLTGRNGFIQSMIH